MSAERAKATSRRRKGLIVAVQAAVSVAVLAWIAAHVGFAESVGALRSIPISAVALATAITGGAFIASGLRWGLILREFAIVLSWGSVVSYYLMGLFLSLFLPTSVGGDAFRIYVVARKSSHPAGAVLGTMQERLLGLCGALAASLAAMPLAGHILPSHLWSSVLAVQLLSLAGLVLVLRPHLMLAFSQPVVRGLEYLGRVAPRIHSGEWAQKIRRLMGEVAGLMREARVNMPLMVVLGLLPAVAISVAYKVILDAIGAPAPAAVMVLIVPMVWIARLLPISLGGIGLGEGAFVLLAALAGIDREKAFAAALAVLAIQIAWALVGGVLLLRSGLRRALASMQG